VQRSQIHSKLRIWILALLFGILFAPFSITLAHETDEATASELANVADANSNNRIDDGEMEMLISYWIMGETVPGTDHTITDEVIEILFIWWITGANLGDDDGGSADDPAPSPRPETRNLEFGDAPDALGSPDSGMADPYPSLREHDGARHFPGDLWLGKARNFESNANVTDNDLFDDSNYAFVKDDLGGVPIILFEADVTTSASYPYRFAYLSVLVDHRSVNCRPQGWGEGDVVLLNEPVVITPGETKRVSVLTDLDEIPGDNTWTRVTITPYEIETPGGYWDGSTEEPFGDGETEDYCQGTPTSTPPDEPRHIYWAIWLYEGKTFYPLGFLGLALDALKPGLTTDVDPANPLPPGATFDVGKLGLNVPGAAFAGKKALPPANIRVFKDGRFVGEIWFEFEIHEGPPPEDDPEDPVPPPPHVTWELQLNDGQGFYPLPGSIERNLPKDPGFEEDLEFPFPEDGINFNTKPGDRGVSVPVNLVDSLGGKEALILVIDLDLNIVVMWLWITFKEPVAKEDQEKPQTPRAPEIVSVNHPTSMVGNLDQHPITVGFKDANGDLVSLRVETLVGPSSGNPPQENRIDFQNLTSGNFTFQISCLNEGTAPFQVVEKITIIDAQGLEASEQISYMCQPGRS